MGEFQNFHIKMGISLHIFKHATFYLLQDDYNNWALKMPMNSVQKACFLPLYCLLENGISIVVKIPSEVPEL